MWTRGIAALVIGIWCFFVLSAALALAVNPGSWVIAIGIGVVAPIVLMTQVNRAIALYEERKKSLPDAGDQESKLLKVLEERGLVTPATVAINTSLTIEEAARMLERLSSKGHLKTISEHGTIAYSLFEAHKPDETKDARFLDDTASPLQTGGEAVVSGTLTEPISDRELEVLRLLASGRTNREIAGDLFVALGTVKAHTNNIYRKLGARNRIEALSSARELRIL